MAQTWDEALATMRMIRHDGAEERLIARLARLDAILDALRAHPFAGAIRVFGSAVGKPGLIPGDIDAFVDLAEIRLPREDREAGLWSLLTLAVQEGYHGNYGLFDPFVLTRRGTLFTRNEGNSRMSVGWQKARCAEGIVAAGREGVPILSLARNLQAEFAGTADVRLPR